MTKKEKALEDLCAEYRGMLARGEDEIRELRARVRQQKDELFGYRYCATLAKVKDVVGKVSPEAFFNTQKFMANFAEAELRAAGAMFVIDGVSAATGSLMVMARADVAITLMVANKDDRNVNKYWVDVVKTRGKNPIRHAFLTLNDALGFIKDYVG